MRFQKTLKLAQIFIASAALAAAPEFREDIRSFSATPGSLSIIAEGRGAVTSRNVLTRVGGVLFQGRIREFGPLELDRLANDADVEVEDGIATITLRQRRFFFWSTEYRYIGPAWIIADSIRFASTPQTAAVTFFGTPSEDEKARIYSSEALEMERETTALRDLYNRNVRQFNQCVASLASGILGEVLERCDPVLAADLGSRAAALGLLAELFTNQNTNLQQSAEARLRESLDRIARGLELDSNEIDELGERTSIVMQSSGAKFTSEFYLADLHPELVNSQLGFRLMQADSMLNPEALLQSVVVGDEEVLFASDRSQLDAAGQIIQSAREASTALTKSLGECIDAQKDLNYQAWILTDFDVEYRILDDEDGLLQIEGEPFYYVWGYLKGDDTPEPNPFEFSECTSELSANSQLYEGLNTNVWMAARDSARTIALFRSLKDEAPDLFSSILEQFVAHRFEFFTPRAWPKDGRL